MNAFKYTLIEQQKKSSNTVITLKQTNKTVQFKRLPIASTLNPIDISF